MQLYNICFQNKQNSIQYSLIVFDKHVFLRNATQPKSRCTEFEQNLNFYCEKKVFSRILVLFNTFLFTYRYLKKNLKKLKAN